MQMHTAPAEEAPEPEPGWRREARRQERRERRERERERERERRSGSRAGAAGGADPSVPPSGVPCSGCGAELHCRDAALPGFLPRHKYLSLAGLKEEEEEEGEAGEGVRGRAPGPLEEEEEEEAPPPSPGLVCQRCWFVTHYRRALRVEVSPEEYRRRVSAALLGHRPGPPGRSPPLAPRPPSPPLLLYVADLTDLPDSLLLLPDEWPGRGARVLPGPLRRGWAVVVVVGVHLISARTGYGVEELISKLQSSWKFHGDVYLVGSANTGKSTLFNALLHSDYCLSKASEIISRATVSPWPGTTLNLLKFPIIAPTPYRIFQRRVRLQEDAKKTEDDLSKDEQRELQRLKRHSYLIGVVGRTFKKTQVDDPEFEFDAEALSYGIDEEPSLPRKPPAKKVEFTEAEVKFCNWLYDTPGIIRDGCILNLLNEKEIDLVLATKAIVPRTFLLKPGMTLFLGALGRIDYLQGGQFSWFSVIASNFLPVHITALEKADATYQKHAGEVLLKVPIGGKERMKDFPPLVPHDVVLEGIGDTEAVADIKLSSAGWVAVTAPLGEQIHLKCYTPEGTKLSVRKPPLLPYIVQVKGKRKKRSPAYETKKPSPLVQNLKSRGIPRTLLSLSSVRSYK
ncbi:hypothetical protein JRQ81_013420 [Phrynocephalus forsythii]|uniref:Nitric oxide associated 1 n=1 Tax=Phrynocephalus forsythii TaxID=171643 RepID=A0A9Q0XZ49_9SAUR|nr:hypothetical protein JRQ81_013420 [Phrynocephalus forsythii]